MSNSEKILIIIGVIVPIFLLLIFIDPIKSFINEFTSVGLSLKEVVIYSTLTTFIILVALAVVSEGGLLGEVQYLIGSFILYFFVSFIIIGYVW